MRVEILRERDNKLLRRKEILLRIKYDDESTQVGSGRGSGGEKEEGEHASATDEESSTKGRGTPSRKEVRELLVRIFKCSPDVLVLDWMRQTFGKCEVLGYVKIYEDEKRMQEIERSHIIRRNFGEESAASAA